MLEEERKYEVSPDFVVPDLAACLPDGGQVVHRPPVTLRATYYDTPDLRLARAGVTLRHRRGEGGPAWTVKLPAESPGVRHEISMKGRPGTPPEPLVALLTAYHRGSPLAPAVTVRTLRRPVELLDTDDGVLAEVVDDTVTVLRGRRVEHRFREIEVERRAGPRKLLDRAGAALVEAGAVGGAFVPKHVRALGERAAAPPDFPPPAGAPAGGDASSVVAAALRGDIWRMVTHEPLTRLRAEVGDGDTAVHQMRVGVRRLRSDLRTFAPLLDPAWAAELREELRWLADMLGAARDAEVLRKRLRATAHRDPLAPLAEAAVARIDADLAARQEGALDSLDKVLAGDRYRALLGRLVEAAREPRTVDQADEPPSQVLPELVRTPWRRLVKKVRKLAPDAPDEVWHAARIAGKRARYAAEAVAPALRGADGGAARQLASALGDIQDLLGEHQDAVVAADTWLAIANDDPDDHVLAVTAGRLVERERAAVRRARDGFPAAWRRASKAKRVRWLAPA